MKKVYAMLLLSLLLFQNAAGAALTDNIIYANSFEWGCSDFKTVVGATAGGISTVSGEGGSAMRISGGMTKANTPRNTVVANDINTGDSFVLELDMKTFKYGTETAAVLFCVSESKQEYYSLSWQQGTIMSYWGVPQPPVLRLCKNSINNPIAGCSEYQMESVNNLFYDYKFNKIKISYDNGEIEVYLNDSAAPVIAYSDATPLRGGAIGFGVSGSSMRSFSTVIDNIKITGGSKPSSDALCEVLDNSVVFMQSSPQAIVNGRLKPVNDVSYNGKPCTNEDGYSMIPARAFALLDGYSYLNEDNTNMIYGHGHNLSLTEGSAVVTLDSGQHTLPVKTSVINGELCVPLRSTAELLGQHVYWHDSGLIFVSPTSLQLLSEEDISALCLAFGKVLPESAEASLSFDVNIVPIY